MEEEKPTSLGQLGVRVVGMVVGFALLYALSFGPAIFLYMKVPQARLAIDVIYCPLVWVASKAGVNPAKNPYTDWWAYLELSTEP